MSITLESSSLDAPTLAAEITKRSVMALPGLSPEGNLPLRDEGPACPRLAGLPRLMDWSQLFPGAPHSESARIRHWQKVGPRLHNTELITVSSLFTLPGSRFLRDETA